jgi:hypothetical protein
MAAAAGDCTAAAAPSSSDGDRACGTQAGAGPADHATQQSGGGESPRHDQQREGAAHEQRSSGFEVAGSSHLHRQESSAVDEGGSVYPPGYGNLYSGYFAGYGAYWGESQAF